LLVPAFGKLNTFYKSKHTTNLLVCFRVTGIFPHNAQVFPEEAFLPAQVNDRLQPDDQVLTVATADPPTTAESASVELMTPHFWLHTILQFHLKMNFIIFSPGL